MSIFAQTYTTSSDAASGGALIFTLLYAVFGLAWFAFGIYCIIDTTKHSEQAFQAAGTAKSTALIITILGLVCCGLLNLYYFFGVRPKVVQAEQAGGGYGGGYPT